MPLIRPGQQSSVRYDQVSKRQLARTVNEQAQRIRVLDEHVKAMSSVLIAITAHPEAFRGEPNGGASVDRAAVERVVKGTRLHLTYGAGGRIVLSTSPPAEERIVTPQIEIPAGVM